MAFCNKLAGKVSALTAVLQVAPAMMLLDAPSVVQVNPILEGRLLFT